MGILSFFGWSSKSDKKVNYESLTVQLQNQLRSDLKTDKDKNFNAEFFRTTDLEIKLINKYGFEGVRLVFESRNSSNYFLLGQFPKDCPWANLNDKSAKDFIDENFKPISKKIPNLISSLKDRNKFIYTERRENTWHLHYLLDMKLYDGRNYYKVYTGGAPILNPEPNSNLKSYKWDVPADLKTFYAIHNGFGEIYDVNFILANEEIRIMAEMLDPICKEQNVQPEGYSFNDLLEFFPDGSGNAQCFYKKDANSTVDWDHEVWEISEDVNFFEFINERMAEIDEE